MINKKYFLILLIVLASVFGFVVRNNFLIKKEPPQQTSNQFLSPTPTVRLYLVTKVIDGDTIEIETSERVRYQGIDAPEKDEKYGLAAAKYNVYLVLGKKVQLEYTDEKFDQYGRLLAYVWLDNMFINEKLVENGFAKVYFFQSEKPKYIDRFETAQRWAKDHHKGLWEE